MTGFELVEAFRKQPLQEVVFLLLHAGLLRSVKVVVLGGGDLVVMIKARINVLSCRILQEDQGKQAFAEEVVKFRVYKEKPYQNSNKEPFGVTINGKAKEAQ